MLSSIPPWFPRTGFGCVIACLAIASARARVPEPTPLAATPEEAPMPAPAPAATAAAGRWIAHSTAEYWKLQTENPDRDLPFDLICDVLYYEPNWGVLWISSGGHGEYAAPGPAPLPIASGDRVRVRGVAKAPVGEFSLVGAQLETVGRGRYEPIPLATPDLSDVQYRNAFVSIEAWVDKQLEVDEHHTRLILSEWGRVVTAIVSIDNAAASRGLADRRIRIAGVFAPRIDPANATLELQLMVPGMEQIEPLGFIGNDPRFDLPVHSISELDTVKPGELVRLTGELVHQSIGQALTLRDQSGQIELRSEQARYLQARQPVDAIGRAVATENGITLTEVEFRAAASDLAVMNADPEAARQLLNLAARIRELPPAEIGAGHIATLRGLVTWSQPDSPVFYLQDSSGGIEVRREPGTPYYGPGVLLDVRGSVAAGDFAPIVRGARMIPLGTRAFPQATEISLEQALAGSVDAQWIALRGYVFAVTRQDGVNLLQLSTTEGDFTVRLPSNEARNDLLRSVVRVEGVCHTLTNGARQLAQVELWTPDELLVQVEDVAPPDPFSLPELPLDRLGRFNPVPSHNNFVKVSGTVLHHAAGSLVYLADKGEVVRVQTRDRTVQRQGDRIEVAGRLGRVDGHVMLRESLLRRIGPGTLPPVLPLPADTADLSGLEGHLVQVEGTLINVLRTASTLRLTTQQGRQIIDAEMPIPGDEPTVVQQLRVGAVVSLTGVLVPVQLNVARTAGFTLFIDHPRGITVVRSPSWWTATRLGTVALSLVLAVVLATVWLRVLSRRVAAQTTQIKHQLEREHQLAEQLQRATRLESLGLLAGGIAHDFNNLLTVVLGNLSMLRLDTPPASEADRSLLDAERAVGRAQQLTQQLLTFAKGGAPVRTAESLPDIVREITSFTLHGTSVRSRLQLAPDAWPAHVDKGQIGQVVQNLVINATQAMGEGGVLKVRLVNEDPAAHLPAALGPGRYLRLEISDNGCGIPAENLPRIFDPYFSTKEKGHGLGLATVYSIVRKHHGDIDVRSTLGRGTTFTIWLPAAGSESADSASPLQPALPRGAGERVLVMDDEAPIRDLAEKMLRHLGYAPVTATDGEAALRLFEQARKHGRPFRTAILDLTIRGGMGGAETLRRLRGLDPDFPAIVSSGYSADRAVAGHTEAGFDGLIPKPYEIRTLARVVHRVLQRGPTDDLPTAALVTN